MKKNYLFYSGEAEEEGIALCQLHYICAPARKQFYVKNY